MSRSSSSLILSRLPCPFSTSGPFSHGNRADLASFADGTSKVPEELQKKLQDKFRGMMSALYKEKGAGLRIEILEEPEVLDFIGTHSEILDSSFSEVRMSDVMRERLRGSDWMFSGMKTFHELNESFPSLLDEEGNRKPFEQFLNDVQSIDSTYNRNYLNAEYNFAQASAGMAARWEDFTEDGDDYLLQYRTAGDDHVRPEHAELNGVTLPASDTFWDTYYPPNGWNCRCTVVQVLKEKYDTTPHEEAMRRGESAMSNERTARMFAFNPGKQQKVFPDYNPYTIRKCLDCPKALNLADGIPDSDNCAACHMLKQKSIRHSAKEIKAEAKTILQGHYINNPNFPHNVQITGRSIKEWINQPHRFYEDKNVLLLDIDEVFKNSRYLGRSDYKETPAHIFEIMLKGEKSWIVIREYPDGYSLHSISDSPGILANIK